MDRSHLVHLLANLILDMVTKYIDQKLNIAVLKECFLLFYLSYEEKASLRSCFGGI